MDKLTELLNQNPCYEQHVVSIKNIYETYLFGILVPIIYEGFLSMYNKSCQIPTKKEINSMNIFQKILRDLPNLNVHKVRRETERIKTASRISDIFDDLIRATVKSNIVLLTYNIDSKRRYLIDSKYHENIIIHDFIHDCYIKAAAVFYKTPELFLNNIENNKMTKNKAKCINIIQDAIRSAILATLPMKEILIEYLNKYEQKDPVYHKQSTINLLNDEHYNISDQNDFDEDIGSVHDPVHDPVHLECVSDNPNANIDIEQTNINGGSIEKNEQIKPDVVISAKNEQQKMDDLTKDGSRERQPRMIDVSPILKTRGTGVALFKQMIDDKAKKNAQNMDEILNP